MRLEIADQFISVDDYLTHLGGQRRVSPCLLERILEHPKPLLEVLTRRSVSILEHLVELLELLASHPNRLLKSIVVL